MGSDIWFGWRIAKFTVPKRFWTTTWREYSIDITKLQQNVWLIKRCPKLHSIAKCLETDFSKMCEILPECKMGRKKKYPVLFSIETVNSYAYFFFILFFFEGTASRKIITVSGDLAMNHISLQLLEVYRNDLAWQRAVFLLQTIRMKYENWSTFSTKFKSYLSKLLPLSKRSSIMLL